MFNTWLIRCFSFSKGIPSYILLLFAFLTSGVQGQLVIDFGAPAEYQKTSGDGVVVCNPSEVDFVSTSLFNGAPIAVGDPDYKYEWDFGGTPSSQETPKIPYLTNGSFNVSLKITKISTGESKTAVKSGFVEVVSKPVIDFTITDGVGCMPLPVKLTNLSVVSGDASKATYEWVLASIKKTTKDATIVIDGLPGTYPASLVVTDEYGCTNQLSKTEVIAKKKPNPEFSGSPIFACLPDLNFTLTAAEQGDFSFEWNVESVGILNGSPVSGAITANGAYGVTLNITGGLGCDTTLTKPGYLKIEELSADFAGPADTLCPGQGATFNYLGTGAETYAWDFGDGQTATIANPRIIPAGFGNRTVCLTVTSSDGACQDQKCYDFFVEEIVPNFTGSTEPVCKIPNNAVFDASGSIAPPNSDFNWVISKRIPGGGFNFETNSTGTVFPYSFTSFGEYRVKLEIESPFGCKRSITKTFHFEEILLSNSIEELDGCVPLQNTYYDNTNYGSYIITNKTFTTFLLSDPASPKDVGGSPGDVSYDFTATEHGDYKVYYQIETADGCKAIDSAFFEAGIKPVADFRIIPQDTCASAETIFADSSYIVVNGQQIKDSINYWRWEHEEGPASSQFPKVKYRRFGHDTLNGVPAGTSPGTRDPYDITLIAGYHGCYDTLTKPMHWEKWGPVLGALAASRRCIPDTVFDVVTGDYSVRMVFSDTLFVFGPMFAWTTRDWNYSFKDGNDVLHDSIYSTEFFPSYQTTTFNGLPVDANTHSQDQSTIDSIFIISPTGFDGTVNIALRNNAYGTCDDCLYEGSISVNDVQKFDFNIPEKLCLTELSGDTTTVILSPSEYSGNFRWVYYKKGRSEEVSLGNNILNVPFTPTDSGTFEVCMVTNFNSPCHRYICKEIEFTVPDVEIEFEKGNNVGCSDLLVDLKGNPVNGSNIVSWEWTVVDISDSQNPINIATYSGQDPPEHNFDDDGDYFFRLVATNDEGCKTSDFFGDSIKVIDPDAKFTIDEVGYCLGDSIKLTNLSVFEGFVGELKYEWWLNDVLIDTLHTPLYELNTVDTFDVTLIVKTDDCSDTLVIPNGISVDPIPKFDFDASETFDNCPPLSTELYPQFTSQEYDGYTFKWDLGEGSVSSNDTVNAVYPAPGDYDVSLIVNTPNGCSDTLIKPAYIKLEGPFADSITVNDDQVCVNDTLVFTVHGGINTEQYSWTFGDGGNKTLTPPDTVVEYVYQTGFTTPRAVTLFLVNGACKIPYTLPVVVEDLTALIKPLDVDTFCAYPQTLTFVNNSVGHTDFDWNLFDGNGYTKNDTRDYTATGEYQVVLSVEDDQTGCKDTDTTRLWIFDPPVLTRTPDTILCVGESVDLTISGADIFEWSPYTGLSNPLNLPDSSAKTSNPANDVTYTVIGTDLLTTCTSQENIVVQRDQTTFDFTLTYPDVCEKELITITYPTGSGFIGNNIDWQINGDFHADAFTTRIPDYNITQPDTVEFSLSVYDKSPRCVQNKKEVVVIHPLPTINLIPDTVLCFGNSVTLFGNGGDAASWEVDVPSEPVPVGYNPTVSPQVTTTYTFTVTDATTNCKAIEDVEVYVDASKALAKIDRIDSCGTGEVHFSDLGSVGVQFIMDWGDGQWDSLPNAISPIKTYANVGVYPQTYIVRDNPYFKTHCEDTLRWLYEVYALPEPVATTADDLICNYESAQLTANGGVTYEWTPANTLSDASIFNPIASPNVTTTYKVKVTDINNCEAETDVTVSVVPEYVVDPKQPNDTIFVGEFVGVKFDIVDMADFSPYNASISWTEDYAMGCNDCDSTSGQPLRTTTYGINTIDPDGCYPKYYEFEIFVIEKYVMDVPSGFTPNEDQVNDLIFVRGIGIKELVHFTIYNRFGEVVFHTEDINEGWDGFYKGKIQNDETYVYQAGVLYYNGETETKRGYISILK